MSVPVFIPYETKTREFDGRLLLISHLLKSGFSEIYFGSKGGVQKEARFHNQGIFIFKSLTKVAGEFYSELRDRGIKIVLLHVEGGIHYKNNMNNILSTFHPELLKLVDLNFVFGNAVKEDIIKFCGKEFYQKTIVSGEPRFDLLKPKYHSFFKKEISFLKGKYKDFILINTSFSAANPVIGNKTIRNLWLTDPTLSAETKDNLMKKMDFQEELILDFISAIKLLSNSYSDKSFIIRPHPSESIIAYAEAFKEYPNVFISKSGNIAEWILSASGVIHYDCTTGMEAALAGKPVISFLPKFDENILAWLPVELSKKVFTIEMLLKTINEIYEGKFENQLNNNIIQEWARIIHNVRHFSSEVIVKELLKLNKSGYLIKNNIDFALYYNRLMSFVKEGVRFINKKVIDRDNVFNKLNKFENCKTKDVKRKLNFLMEIEQFDIHFKVTQIRSDVVLIKKSN